MSENKDLYLNTQKSVLDTSDKNAPKNKQIGVYTLKGVVADKPAVKIEFLGLIDIEKAVVDSLFDTIKFTKYIIGYAHICNITSDFLMANKTLPMLYIQMMYDKGLYKYHLLTLSVLFTIKSEIKTEQDLIGNDIFGEFTTEVTMDNTTKILTNKIEKFTSVPDIIDK
jgi:hypothetical protein